MQKVRFTIEELKGNVKFLYWLITLSVVLLVVAQLKLMLLEKKSFKMQSEWIVNENFLYQYQNAFYTTHDVQFAITKEYATTISKALNLSENPEVANGPFKEYLPKWKENLEIVLNARGHNGMESHNHQLCIGFIAQKEYLIGQARIEYRRELASIQESIDLVNLLILLFPVVILALLIYAAFFVNYGGE